MREKFKPFIKFCGTLTVSSPGTESIGLAADAQVSWFLLFHLDSFIVTPDFSAIYQNLQKPRHRDPSLALWAGSDGN
jgi:hypothetical protein